MPLNPPESPLIFDASMESPEEDEAETGQGLVETLHKIAEITYKDGHHAIRPVHAKSHGLLKAELIVGEGLPPVLSHGLFAKPGRYPAVMRFSTTPGDILDDKVSTPRGLAVKILNVDSPGLPGAANARTQDFLLVNGKTFSGPNGKAFLNNLKLLALTTDKAEGLKVALSSVLQLAERRIEALGGKSGTIVSLGGHPETDILGESFYGQLPFLYGPHVAKIAIVPVSPNLTALTGAKVDLHDKPNGLREAVIAAFAHEGGEWEVRIQLATTLDETPIVTVARLIAGPQTAWSEPRQAAVDDGMAFSPWHCLAAHRPLGSIMRMRKAVYEMAADFRSTHNRCPIHEPASLDAITD
jgi:hypothetical protein